MWLNQTSKFPLHPNYLGKKSPQEKITHQCSPNFFFLVNIILLDISLFYYNERSLSITTNRCKRFIFDSALSI